MRNQQSLEIELRLTQARYYQAVLQQSLFEDPDEAACMVEEEVRGFIMSRLEDLLGLNKPKVIEAPPQFTQQEVDALKVLAKKLLSAEKPMQVQGQGQGQKYNPEPHPQIKQLKAMKINKKVQKQENIQPALRINTQPIFIDPDIEAELEAAEEAKVAAIFEDKEPKIKTVKSRFKKAQQVALQEQQAVLSPNNERKIETEIEAKEIQNNQQQNQKRGRKSKHPFTPVANPNSKEVPLLPLKNDPRMYGDITMRLAMDAVESSNERGLIGVKVNPDIF